MTIRRLLMISTLISLGVVLVLTGLTWRGFGAAAQAAEEENHQALPALIANNYGDMMSIPLYDAALLCAALILLGVILIFNIAATLVLKRFMK